MCYDRTMSFTVDDFQDFLAVLGAHPEWQVRLRRMLLDAEMALLRQEMRRNTRNCRPRWRLLPNRAAAATSGCTGSTLISTPSRATRLS